MQRLVNEKILLCKTQQQKNKTNKLNPSLTHGSCTHSRARHCRVQKLEREAEGKNTKEMKRKKRINRTKKRKRIKRTKK